MYVRKYFCFNRFLDPLKRESCLRFLVRGFCQGIKGPQSSAIKVTFFPLIPKDIPIGTPCTKFDGTWQGIPVKKSILLILFLKFHIGMLCRNFSTGANHSVQVFKCFKNFPDLILKVGGGDA